MATPKIIADFESQLSTAITVGSTTFSLSSATDDDGVALPTGLYYFTVDNGSTNKEFLAGTLSGTSVTGVLSVSRQGVETSGAVRAHRIGASVILTDFATYMVYMNAIALVSAPDASTSAKGVLQAPTTAQVNAATPTGSTGAKLAVTPDALAASIYGLQLPTVAGKLFVDATTGMISMYGGSAAPTGFLLCDGTAVSRATYAALFAVTSTLYGVGDGSTTFNLPDGRGRHFIGAGTGTKVATFASRTGNVITVTGLTNVANNEFQTGQAVTYHTSGSVITGLTNDTVYYIVRVSNTTFSLATSLALAQNGTVIALSSDGTGTQTFTLALTARTRGDYGGEENHAMSMTELISHAHDVSYNSSSSTAGATAIGGSNTGANGTFPTAATGIGGNVAMNIMSPFFVGNWIIKT